MRLAIIGSGISGLGAAYLLGQDHEIVVYEKADYIGGHSCTIDVPNEQGSVAVDTGFIVFNKVNYPHLTALFDRLGVELDKSDMSFGASIDNGWLEYGTRYMGNVIAQKSNLLKPLFWKMLYDILRFNARARRSLHENETIGLGQFLDKLGVGRWFREYYLLAMGGAIWSIPLSKMLDFPAITFVRFFENHGLLTVSDHHQWYTVRGGSREYVKLLTSSFTDRIYVGRGAKQVKRLKKGVQVIDESGGEELFDQVIFACHSDQVLQLLEDPTDEERKIIGGILYQPNRVVMHSDQSFMPKRRQAWSSWVYLSDDRVDMRSQVSLSYWMNNLQPSIGSRSAFVTLNPHREPSPESVMNVKMMDHPVFDQTAMDAQSNLHQIQGKDRVWFCGAWQGRGFHEDGLRSAVEVAQHLGSNIPWS